jgi:hypothetical protein
VKVHNNGRDAEIGKLQLFVAESSATPTGWVLVGETGEIKVEGRPPTGQERGFSVAKFDWLHQWPSGVPVDTGYSLIARWNPVVSDGSSPSVTDVRASKELALRTGDTIELDGSSEHAQYSSTFQVAGESGSYLLITTETNEPSVGWDVVVPSASVTIDGTEQHTIALEQTPSMVLGPYDTTTVRLNTSHGTGDAIASARDDGFAVAGADYTISFIQIRATGVIAGAEPALRAELETLFVEGKVVGGVSYSLRIPPAP